MNEKELVISLAENNEEVNILLSAMRENTKGNFQFKKMKLKRLIKKNPEIDLVGEILVKLNQHGLSDFSAYELPILLKQLSAQKVTKMMQYLIVTNFYQDFTKENLSTIVDNAQKGNEPFHGLHGFDNDRDLEFFYQHNYDELQEAKDESELDHIISWFEEAIISLDGFKKRLAAIDLSEFDRLITTKTQEPELQISPSFLKREDRSHYKDYNVPDDVLSDLKKAVDGEGTKLALYLAYFEVGMYNKSIKSTLLDSIQRHYLTFRMQLMGAIKIIDDVIFFDKHEALSKDYENLVTKMDKSADEYEAKIEKLSKDLEDAQIEKKQSETDAEGVMTHLLVLRNQIMEQDASAAGYKKMLRDDFTNLKIVVVHDSQLLYAPSIFPDVEFLRARDVLDDFFAEVKLVLIQGFGGSAKKVRQLEIEAKAAKCDVLSLKCEDERQLIMAIANTINERRLH